MNWFTSICHGLARLPGRLARDRQDRRARQEHHLSEAERLDRIRNPGKYLDRVNAGEGSSKTP